MNHPSAPSTCVLGSLNIPSVTPSPDLSSPPSGGEIWELVFPGSSCPFYPTPWSAWRFKSPGTGVRLPSCPIISPQRQNGPGQRVIREVNTTTRACALWGLAEDSDYTVQVRSIGLRGESPPGPRVHFRTLKGSDRLPSNSSSPGDITVEGLDGERPLQTGEVVIIVVVLLMWAAVIGLFCRQYDIIKDNDSNNNPKEKGKGPEQSPQGRPVGTRQKKSSSINTIDV
ncbi:fibronectin type III domain-containing protein 4 isoform X2 [Mirounga leonina]|uniref:Fibronectin type III domain-containing protein 4 isoform X2 n=1 Tax=Neomonachus schauinslandi TaxID=29088 RepID=A0A8M1MLN3_NEOSC|nr:fibronectin type III domain-containing protein 4 isoform X2 [Neomonachus schauinslandi]XP_034856694.1 fibronectin type III domain-containing protein 4 isoform X2 [Mirounga leonina]XP_044774757.1 fibronectin type III domain-containing protein 4 isoform X2 [Neomonachus schauinslandi]